MQSRILIARSAATPIITAVVVLSLPCFGSAASAQRFDPGGDGAAGAVEESTLPGGGNTDTPPPTSPPGQGGPTLPGSDVGPTAAPESAAGGVSQGLPPSGGLPPASAPTATQPSAGAGSILPSPLPQDPRPFARGSIGPRGSRQVGSYLSLPKLVWVIGGFFAWVWLGQWISEDAKGLSVRPVFWNTLFLVTGLAGLLCVLSMPSFLLGNLSMMTLVLGPAYAYVYERNQKVPPGSRILDKKHLTVLATRALAKVGIHIGPREVIEQAAGPPITFIGRSDGKGTGRGRNVEKSRGYLASKELMYDAILRRATDVHMEPKEDEYAVRLRIDGVMYPTDPFDKATGDAAINIFKVLSAIDITEKRRSQDGSFAAELEGREVDFRVATQNVRNGESVTIRILDQDGSVSTLGQLGMRKSLAEQIRGLLNDPHGMFLTCGPTGAGKSTTLYAALNEIDSHVRNVITIEDPIEYKMSGVKQIEINTKADQTFAGSLRAVLRQDPDVVMVGEIRDKETAVVGCQAATTGHMVLSTLHANDTITALFRLLDLGVEPFMVSGSVTAILGQRLARRLCPECRVAYKPKADVLESLKLPASKVKAFYTAPKGSNDCHFCGGLGYRGRVGVYELMEVSERMQDLIREKASMKEIRAEARKNGMLYMREEGLRLVVNGTTSLEELQRVVK